MCKQSYQRAERCVQAILPEGRGQRDVCKQSYQRVERQRDVCKQSYQRVERVERCMQAILPEGREMYASNPTRG